MNEAKRRIALTCVAALGLLAAFGGCSPAEGERLEVTYYYLPG